MEDGVDRPCGTPLLLGHARRLCVSTTLWDSMRISLRKEPSTAQERGAADRAVALVAMRTIAVPAVRAHSDFFLTAWTVARHPWISHCSSPTPFLGIVSLRGYLIFSVRCTRGSNAPVERAGGEARCLVYQSLDSETPLSSGESTRTTRNYVDFRNAKDTWCRSRFT